MQPRTALVPAHVVVAVDNALHTQEAQALQQRLAREHDRPLTPVDYFRHPRLRATVPPCPTIPASLL
jgi:hypothetical protein